jgi:hypothetical protein
VLLIGLLIGLLWLPACGGATIPNSDRRSSGNIDR